MENFLDALIKPLISKWIEPRLTKIVKSAGVQGKLMKHDVYTNQFIDYFLKKYRKFQTIDTIVFQNTPKPFHKLYEPLTLTKDSKVEVNADVRTLGRKYKIHKYRQDLVPYYRRIVIRDTAGMGKSTLLKKMFLSIIEENAGIPVFLELRKLRKSHKIITEIMGQLTSFEKEIDEELILELIKRGDFIFLLDGLDEIILSDKDIIIRDIQDFIELAPNNNFVLASRNERSVLSFGNFESFSIEPLKKKEAFSLLKKYDSFNYKSIVSDLIIELKKEENESVLEFLENPLLVTLLYRAYDYKRKISFNKAQFYRQVFDALYENHDLTKGGFFVRPKKSGLNIDDFEKMLRYLAFLSAKIGKLEFTKNELLEIIDQSKSYCNELSFNSSDYLEDIVSNVPLLSEEGLFYKWSHKSMQDYFAARFIYVDAKEKQKDILSEIYKPENFSRYLNVMDIFYYMDYRTFRNTIVYSVLCECIDFCSKDIDRIGAKMVGSTFSSVFRTNHSELCNWLTRTAKLASARDEIRYAFISLDIFYFDYEKCLELKSKIEEDINHSKGGLFSI